MIAINITQFNDGMTKLEAEASLTAASMKLHAASKEVVRCRKRLEECQLALSEHVRQSGLDSEGLVSYFVRRELLANECTRTTIALAEAEEAEASAEVEWESAAQYLTDLAQ